MANGIKIGNSDITLKLGSSDVTAAYLGDTLVYSGGTPPVPSYSGQYLTFVAQDDGTFTFTPQNSNVISYSLDSGATWSQGNSVSVESGQKVMWKGEMIPYLSDSGIGNFSSTINFHVEGNIMSLLYGDNFRGQTDLTGKDGAFRSLFDTSASVTSAENLILPSTTLTQSCYSQMFRNCTSLTTAPELPATTLAMDCYRSMFEGCTSLTTAPSLPATTLADACYENMFGKCTILTIAPELPATTLAKSCYSQMFNDCTSLTTAPSLPATTLANYCYQSMFRDCTSLTTAPSLPATTLAKYCYYYMFYGCESLSAITCLATDISASNCTISWVSNVAASGIFTKASSMTSWTEGTNGIPIGWTVVDYMPPYTKWIAIYNDNSISSAQCDSTSAISQNEIS